VQPLAPKGNTIASALKKSLILHPFSDSCVNPPNFFHVEPGPLSGLTRPSTAPEQQNCLAATHPLHAYLTTLRENANGFVAKRMVAGARRMQRRSVWQQEWRAVQRDGSLRRSEWFPSSRPSRSSYRAECMIACPRSVHGFGRSSQVTEPSHRQLAAESRGILWEPLNLFENGQPNAEPNMG